MKPFFYTYNTGSQFPPKHKHDTQEAAVAESLRLAKKHPGASFEILKCVAISQTSEASTFWMDGEEPPEKPRYRMLEEGEIIGERDQYLENGQWNSYETRGSIGEEFSLSGKPNGRHLPHRRPL